MHESKMHTQNCFITLTYAPFTWIHNRRSSDSDLVYAEFQKFMKRFKSAVRRKYGKAAAKSIRFYMAGEYGENFGRPHFHACIFGFNFQDRKPFFRTPSGNVIYRSAMLESLWPYGFSSVADFSFETAAYVARYVMKKMTGDAADLHYEAVDPNTGEIFWRIPEFNRMSLKPGIGATFFEKYKTDIFPHDHVIHNGKPVSVPRYYDKLFERLDSDNLVTIETKIKPARLQKAILSLDDNTPERLAVKEQVSLENLKKLKRKLA